VFFCAHDAAATRGQYLALSRASGGWMILLLFVSAANLSGIALTASSSARCRLSGRRSAFTSKGDCRPGSRPAVEMGFLSLGFFVVNLLVLQ